MPRRSKKAEPIDDARRSLSVFRALQPTLNAYARMLTGNPRIKVVADVSSNGCTDGKAIYYRPPLSLGADVPHSRHLCDRRDEQLVLRCAACSQREYVLRTIYHEIAHIWFKSFDPLSAEAKDTTIRLAVKEVNSEYGKKVAQAIAKIGDSMGYMGLARFISPYLPMLLNALEDGRVNRELHRALPGTKVMFASTTGRIFREGVEQRDPKTGGWGKKLWREYPLNSQAVAGVLCMAQGYDFKEWLDPFVVQALEDEQLHELVMKIQDASSMDTAFSLSFPVLARLRELGFCRSEEDPEDGWEPPFSEPSEESSDDDAAAPEEDDPSDAGGGESSPGSDDDSDGSDAGENQGDAGDEPSEGDEVSDGSDAAGGDDPGGDASGSSEAGDEADDDSDSGHQGSGSAGADSGDGEVPEETSGTDGAETSLGGSAGGDSAGDGDGDGSAADEVGDDDSESGPDLDGLSSPDSGSQGDDESSPDRSDSPDDAGDGEDADLTEDDVETLDTGANEGGIRVDDRPPARPDLDWGTPEEVEMVVMKLGDHKVVHHHDDEFPSADDPDLDTPDSSESEHAHLHRSAEDEAGDDTIKKVLLHGNYFETPASGITEVLWYKEGDRNFEAQSYDDTPRRDRIALGIDGNFDPPESTIGPAVSRGRIVFSNEARTRHEFGLKRGRVHGASLARRAPFNDPKMFSQKRIPDSQDHFVGIGIDISASTWGENLKLAKQVAFAEAEVLNRLGVPFFMMAHSGDYNWSTQDSSLTIREIKASNEPWSDKTRNRLRRLSSSEVNLDGHTIEIYRGLLEQRREQVKIMHYYTDGKMPAENHDEELEILRREILTYRRKKLNLVGVGIRTDSPREHGLDTIQVDTQADVLRVVTDLEKRLTKR